jgi:hypothetical protein
MDRGVIKCEVSDLKFFIAAVMKNSVFWDEKPYSPFKVERRFGGTYRLHLQGRKMRQGGNQYAVAACSR